MTDELAFCNPVVTCVVDAKLETVWQVMKQWGTFYWLKTGEEGQIGSVRTVEIGDSLMFERLVAVDDETHTMKWRTMAHEDSVSPFKEASYLNSLITFNIREITHGDHTFCEWRAEFYTEQEFASMMHSGLEGWIIGAFETLQEHMLTDNPTVDPGRQAPPVTQPTRPERAEDHMARFADLHISSGMAPPYGQPSSDATRYARGMQAPYEPEPVMQQPGRPVGLQATYGPEPVLRQPGRPMGSSSRQAPPVVGSQPAWHGMAAPPMGQTPSIPPAVNPVGTAAVQEWAAKQQQAHYRQTRQQRPMGSTYAPSHISERSNSFDEPDAFSGRRSHADSRYPARGMRQQNVQQPMDPLYDSVHPDPRQEPHPYWEGQSMGQAAPAMRQQAAPMGASARMYETPDVYTSGGYDPRAGRPSNRSRPSGSSGHPNPRASR